MNILMSESKSIEIQSAQSLFIKMYFNKTCLSSGTAFIVKKDTLYILITAKHNLTGHHFETDKLLSKEGAIPNKIEVFHHVKGKLGSWKKQSYLLYPKNNEFTNPLFATHNEADVAALIIDCKGYDVYFYDININPKIHLTPAEPLSVIGFPFGKGHGGYLSHQTWAIGFASNSL